jgi:hypothetical protein
VTGVTPGGAKLGWRELFDRYGPTLVVVVAISLLVALLPGNASKSNGTSVNASGNGAQPGEAANSPGAVAGAAAQGQGGATAVSSAAGGGGAAAASGAAAAANGTGAPGQAAGSALAFGQGPNCRADGRQKGISRYMPPCVKFIGDNGGTTSRGVTKDRVLVMRYFAQRDPGTQAILQGAQLADDPAVVKRAYTALFAYSNQHYETYHRQIVFEDYAASGGPTDDEASKADAITIANDKKAFAVIEGDPAALVPKVLASELAQRGVICVCTTSLSSQFYKENPPYIFSSLPTSDEYAAHIAEYIGKRLAGKTAKWAGDELNPAQGYTTTPRKFGLIYLEGQMGKVDPEGKRARDLIVGALAKYGVQLSAEASYLYDPGRNQQDVTNVIAKMKAAGVTTVIPYVDPLYPILFTKEATRQLYYPEWFISGTGLSDTTAAGRLYDQAQWRHGFGISPLYVTWQTVATSGGYREFHHGMPGMKPGDEGVLINIYAAYVGTLFLGIHMAGPKLTADTFSQGTFNYPPTGGLPAAPFVFMNRAFPTQSKDMTEVWYNPSRRGPDERSQDGVGMIMKVDGGHRYRLGQWPAGDPRVFDPNGAIDVSDNPPGGGDPPHEQDGHGHPASQRCLDCQ